MLFELRKVVIEGMAYQLPSSSFWSNHFLIRCQTKVLLYWLQVSLRPDSKNLVSGVPSLMAADKPCPQLQPSLISVPNEGAKPNKLQLKVGDFQKKIGIIYRLKQICRFTILSSSFEFFLLLMSVGLAWKSDAKQKAKKM